MGYELDKIMSQYGVSTPTIAPAPFTPAAPTAPVQPTGDAATPEAWDKYNSQNAQYGFNKTAYDTNVTNLDANKALYDKYKLDYQGRVAATPMYSDAQYSPQSKFTPPQQLAAPAYNTATAQQVPVNTGKVYSPGGGGLFWSGLPTDFNWVEYVNKNPDLYAAGIDTPQEAAAHWNLHGQYENRAGAPAPTPQAPVVNNPQGGGLFSGLVGNLANKYGVGMAKGGSVKHLADKYGFQHYEEGDLAVQDPAAVTEASQAPSAPADANSQPYRMSPQIADVMQRNRDQQEQYNAMLDQSLNSPEMSKIGDSEKYLRLASAFLSPTKTGAFTENLGLAAGQMSEINKSQREAALSSLKLKLVAQKLRVEAGRDELQALKGAYPMATPGQVMTNTLGKERLTETEKQNKIHNDYLERVEEGKRIHNAKVEKDKADKTALSPEERDLGIANIGRMNEINETLNKNRAIKGGLAEQTMGGDMAAGLLSSDILQPVQGFFATENQKLRDEYKDLKNSLLMIYKKKFNITGREMDTPAEQERLLKTFGDPGRPYAYNKNALGNFMNLIAQPTAKPAAGPKTVDFKSWK